MAPRQNPSATTPKVLNDTRGAVLVTGLFMACFLIGVLWYMVGIGDAIVYHDKAQEAADATSFTAATVHARGMNFISALNLVMLALVAIHIIMGLVYYTIQGIAIACAAIPLVDIPCDGALEGADEAWLEGVWTPYADLMKPALTVLSYTEYGAAVIYPWAAEASGVYVAGQYGEVGVTLSPSMIPGNAISGGLSEKLKAAPSGSAETEAPPSAGFSLKGSDTKLGLPVEEYKYSALCKVLFGAVADFIMKIVKNIPVIGTILSIPGIGSAISSGVRTVVSSIGAGLLCNEVPSGILPSFDTFWGEKGPKFVWSQASNGNDWMQVWSFVLNANYNEVAQARVAVAQGPTGGKFATPAPPTDMITFYSQAEFYFDCTDNFNGESCNQNYYASWAMRWRARLRRVRPPSVINDLLGYAGTLLLQGGALDFIKGKVKDSGIFDKVKTVTDKFGSLGNKAFAWLSKDEGGGIDTAANQIKKLLTPKGAAVAAGNPMIH